jgi:chitinase
MEKNLYAEQIAAIRKRGGDVIISFGGAGGTELGIAEKDVAVLEAKYQSIIDRYQFTWLDFDIEGKALGNTEANERRNVAIAALQKKNPGLRVTFTLPVDPNGIGRNSRAMLSDAKAKGIQIYSANIMTMDYGVRHSAGKKMSDVSIASALKTYEQVQAIDPAIKVGLCPMIGQNDVKEEVFSLEDARALRDWAMDKPWICSIHFWSSNRDTGKPGRNPGVTRSGIQQQPWDFTNIFKSFTAPPPASDQPK